VLNRLSPRFSVAYLAVLSGMWLSPSSVYADESSYSLSLNAGVAPRYQGSKEYTVTAGPGFRADFGNGWFIDPTQGGAGYALRFLNGMFASAALSYDPGRSDTNRYGRPGSDHLKGMGTVKGSLLGVFTVGGKLIGDTTGSATLEVPITHRERGWSGHIDVAAPVVSWGSDKITVSPSLHFGSRKYMQTYFGVTPQQAANSGFAEYSASSGLQAATLTVAWTHTFSRHWAMQTAVGASRLLGNAAKSPIVQNKQSYFGGTGLVYTF
jgi:outer membrane scaffolding protein for murein synthesis (MipA/OmpV family)